MNSLLFGMTFKDHMFVIVPKMLKNELDWRLPVFECGRHLIAFDGAPLLLSEVRPRSKADERDGETNGKENQSTLSFASRSANWSTLRIGMPLYSVRSKRWWSPLTIMSARASTAQAKNISSLGSSGMAPSTSVWPGNNKGVFFKEVDELFNVIAGNEILLADAG